VEELLQGRTRRFEARTTGPGELAYEVHLPIRTRPDRILNEILALAPATKMEVAWEEKQKD
jgi:hypothetical protein